MTWTRTARDQAGLITRAQLQAAGVPPRTIDQWSASRRLERLAPGVYRIAGSADTPMTVAWRAVLISRSPLSYLSSARWWDVPVEPDGLVHITRPGRRRLNWPRGVRMHRVALRVSDIVEHRGMPVVNRTETLLDCIGSLSPGRAITLADRAMQSRWLDVSDIERRLDESPGRWGNRQLRRVAATVQNGAEAESERRLHRLLRDCGVTGWTPQFPVITPAGRWRIDVAFPELRLAIEVDGYAYHSGDAHFQHDRTRQNALIAAGWRVLRFTWADIVDRPAYVVDQVRTVLAA